MKTFLPPRPPNTQLPTSPTNTHHPSHNPPPPITIKAPSVTHHTNLPPPTHHTTTPPFTHPTTPPFTHPTTPPPSSPPPPTNRLDDILEDRIGDEELVGHDDDVIQVLLELEDLLGGAWGGGGVGVGKRGGSGLRG